MGPSLQSVRDCILDHRQVLPDHVREEIAFHCAAVWALAPGTNAEQVLDLNGRHFTLKEVGQHF
jgi:hypothetical protein